MIISKKQSGFALPIAILIAIILIIAGGAGYYFYKTSQEEKEKEEVPFVTEEKVEEEKVLETPEGKEEEKKEEITPKEEGPKKVSNTTRTGTIFRDEIWSGTIHVTGDIVAKKGTTLTILPGTIIYIAANSDDTNKGREETSAFEYEDPIRKEEYAKNHIEINAKIIARGAPDNKILFTSDAQDKKFADWQHIGLEEGSVIDNVIVEYGGRAGLSVNGKGEDVTISNSTIRHVLWGCIALGSSFAKVIGNEIYDCGHEGIDTQPGGGKPIIKNNTLKNSARGLMLNDDSFPLVENNTIIDNAIGIEVRGGGEIINNYISSPNGPANDWVYENFVYKRNAPRAHTGGPDPEPRTGIITTGKATLSGNIIENVELEIKVEG